MSDDLDDHLLSCLVDLADAPALQQSDVAGAVCGDVQTLNAKARHAGISELVEWALPIQERHFSFVQATGADLANAESPDDPA